MKTHSLKTVLALTCSVGAALAACAGDFSIDWFTIDGGGGTSTGGVFSVSGTIGQPDAGQLTGGNYTLVGGFWSVIQDADAPWLSIRLAGSSVVLSWPNPSTGFQLQQTATLNGLATTWTDVNQAPAIVNADKEVTLLVAPGSRRFRLRKP